MGCVSAGFESCVASTATRRLLHHGNVAPPPLPQVRTVFTNEKLFTINESITLGVTGYTQEVVRKLMRPVSVSRNLHQERAVYIAGFRQLGGIVCNLWRRTLRSISTCTQIFWKISCLRGPPIIMRTAPRFFSWSPPIKPKLLGYLANQPDFIRASSSNDLNARKFSIWAMLEEEVSLKKENSVFFEANTAGGGRRGGERREKKPADFLEMLYVI